MWIVRRTLFFIFALFVKQYFQISRFFTDLSTEWVLDEMSKEFFILHEKSDEIQMNYE